RTLIAFQSLPGDSALFKSLIEKIKIAVAPQEFQIGFTDDDVIRSGVVVEFLMPFLHEMSRQLFDVMTMHDIQYLVADPLRVLPCAERCHYQADKLTFPGLIDIAARQFICKAAHCMA